MPKCLESVVVGPFAVNCYLYWDQKTGKGVVIDPGADQQAIFSAINRVKMRPAAILLTHGHGDHIAAVRPVKEEYNIPVYIGRGEEHLLTDAVANVSALFAEPIIAPAADATVEDEEILKFGSVKLRVLATPGHTPAGVCYFDENEGVVFCGDTLFAGSIGRTDFPGSSQEILLNSIGRKLLKLPDEVICFPGHGPKTTIGAERTSNPFLFHGYYG